MNRKQIVQAFQIAFTYIGTVVGAGFASGREILSFFSVFGEHAYTGVIISTCLFAWVGIRILYLGYELQANSYRQVTAYLFGERLATLIDLFMLVMLFGVTVAMLAGVGALFAENLRLPFQLGVLATMGLTYVTIRNGMKGILTVNSIIVPVMITIICLIFLRSWAGGQTPANMNPAGNFSLSWLASAVAYAALNLGLALSVLVPLGNEIRDKKALLAGGIIGATGLGIMLMGAHFAMSMHMPDILKIEVPMAFITNAYGPLFKTVFLLVLWGEIFSTLIANVYGIASQFASPRLQVNSSLATVMILTAAFFVSQVGFSNIVTYMYPVFGYLSFLLLLLLIWPRSGCP